MFNNDSISIIIVGPVGLQADDDGVRDDRLTNIYIYIYIYIYACTYAYTCTYTHTRI